MLRKWLKCIVSLYARSLYEVSNALNRDNALCTAINFAQKGNLKKAGAVILTYKNMEKQLQQFFVLG
jgi:hypothetical protein